MPRLFVMSAPSGAGKTSLAERLINKNPHLKYSVSFTSRKIRPQEVEGVNYFFVEKLTFKGMIEKNELLEWAETFGNFYGTSRIWVEKMIEEGHDVFLDIDVVGAKQIKAGFPDAVFIFVLPPSFKELEKRLAKRGTESADQLKLRLAQARSEVDEINLFHYLVVNDSLDKATEVLENIIEGRGTPLTSDPQALDKIKADFFERSLQP